MKKKKGLILKIILGILILWIVVRSIDVGQFFGLIKNANPLYLLLCGMLLNIDRFFMAFKWRLLINHQKNERVAFFPLVKSYYLASVVSSIVPPTIGEDIVRGISVSRDGMSSDKVLSSILAERLFGTLAMFIIVVCSLTLLIWNYPQIDKILLYGTLAMTVVLVLLIIVTFYLPVGRLIQMFPFLNRKGKFMALIEKFYAVYQAYRQSKKEIIFFVILSIVENCFAVVGNYWIALAIHLDVQFIDFLLIVPAIALFSKIPITFGGIGTQEGIFVTFLALIGVPSTHAFTMSILGRVINIVAVLPVFLFLYTSVANRPNASNLK